MDIGSIDLASIDHLREMSASISPGGDIWKSYYPVESLSN